MKTLFLALPILLAACGGRSPDLSAVKYDAAHSIALDGTIDEGTLVATSQDQAVIKNQILQQLWFTVGQLNANDGVADMARLESIVSQVTPRADGKFDVKYAAKLFVSWPREQTVPAAFPVVLPAGGDYQALDAFWATFGNDDAGAKKCMDWDAHDVSESIWWYYYRPAKAGCPLANPSEDDPALVRRAVIRLAVSGQNTSGKSPEYGKIWEDGKLVVTAIFGKFEAGATSDGDAGISAFQNLYSDLISAYGQPLTTNLAAGVTPDAAHDDVRLTFHTASGPLDIHVYLVDGIQQVDQAFKAKYNERTKISDFVSYSGHSGLGANIRALARMGQFVPGQYQVFMVNGCDTFAYVDNALRDAHQAANPTFGPDKFYDMITNSMPSYFNMDSRSNMAVIEAMVGKQQTYRDILAGFDQAQRAVVTGEQDNLWPLPFDSH